MAGTRWLDLAQYTARARADLSVSVTHWTKRNLCFTDENDRTVRHRLTAFDVLKRIIRDRRIRASTTESGFIKGNQRATCFSEAPVIVMARLFKTVKYDRQAKPFLHWESCGLSFLKPIIYQKFGGRPVLYLSQEEYHQWVESTGLVEALAWRVVRFDQAVLEEAVDFSHEREWRVRNDVIFDGLRGIERPLAVVDKTNERDELLQEFPPGDESPIRGVFCLQDLRVLG